MASPLLAAKCPSCGGSLQSSVNIKGTKCPYCSTLLLSQDHEEFCSCGRPFTSMCSRCGTRLCNTHSFSIRQFNLSEMIRTYAPNRYNRANSLIQILHSTTDPTAIHCSSCSDSILEYWILNSLKSQQ